MGTDQATVEVGTGQVVVADIDRATVVGVDTVRAVAQDFKQSVEVGTILVIIEVGTDQVVTEEGMLLAAAATLVKLDTVEVATSTDFAIANPLEVDCTTK